MVPLPNWPHSFAPQHRTVPSPRSAQLWCHHPAVTPTAPVIPLTGTGVVRFVVVPFPSCPNWPCPQHWTAPFPSSAQVCRHPALTSTTPVSPATCTGVVDVRGRAVAELPELVFSPAPHRAVGQHRARVGAAAADGGGAGEAGHRHRRGRVRVGPVAQLRVAVPSPAPHACRSRAARRCDTRRS